MIIKMKTIDVTDKGNFYPGNIRNVSDEHAKELISAGAAVEVKGAPKAENKLSPAAPEKAAAIIEVEKLVAELEKEAKDFEEAVKDLPKDANKDDKKEAYKAAKAARNAADEAAAKLADLKKAK